MTRQMSTKHPTPPDQRTNPTQSLSRTARDPFLLTAQTVKHQHHTKRKVLQANTHRALWSPPPTSAYIPIVPLPPTENLHTKRTITATKKRRAKRTTWSPQLQVRFILRLKLTLEGITAPLKPKRLQPPASAPQLVMWTVLMTMVRRNANFKACCRMIVYDIAVRSLNLAPSKEMENE